MNTVTVTLASWEDKLDIIKMSKKTPFSGTIQNPESDHEYDNEIDKVHAKMLKFSLGVSKYTSNTAVFMELGQIPVSVKAKVLTAMYLHRFHTEIHMDNHFLLHNAFKCMKEYSHPWIDSIHYLFASHGMADIYNNITSRSVTKGKLKKLLITRLSDIYIQYNDMKMQSKPYLGQLYSLTTGVVYQKQTYLNVVSTPQTRMIYARVRTNSSKLSPSPYSEIIDKCESCKVTMDFKHLLLHCKNTEKQRDSFFKSIQDLHYNIDVKSDGLYNNIMNLEWPLLSREEILVVIPIVLSYVGHVGRDYVI